MSTTSGDSTGLPIREATRRQRRRMIIHTLVRIVVGWAVLFAIYFGIPFDRPEEGWPVVLLIVSLGVFFTVAVSQIRRTSRSNTPGLQAAMALGTLIPLLLITFAGVYFSIASARPTTFNQPLDKTAAMYFTITTLATVGFGDIVAVSTAARLLVCVQILIDLLLVGVIVRSLGQAVQFGRAQSPPSGAAGPLELTF